MLWTIRRDSLLDLVNLMAELERIIRRAVDPVGPAALTNPYRRQHILETAQLPHAAIGAGPEFTNKLESGPTYSICGRAGGSGPPLGARQSSKYVYPRMPFS